MATLEQSLPRGLHVFGPKFEKGERLVPALVIHRTQEANAVYVDVSEDYANTYVPKDELCLPVAQSFDLSSREQSLLDKGVDPLSVPRFLPVGAAVVFDRVVHFKRRRRVSNRAKTALSLR